MPSAGPARLRGGARLPRSAQGRDRCQGTRSGGESDRGVPARGGQLDQRGRHGRLGEGAVRPHRRAGEQRFHHVRPLGNAELGTVAEAIDVNLFGPWRVIHALLPMLRSSSRPRIVNVSSEGGSISAMTGGSPAYGISKAGLNALTRLLAGELARDGILVNAVCPGWPASEAHPQGRSLAQAAASVIWAVTIPNGGPTGTFTRDGQPVPW